MAVEFQLVELPGDNRALVGFLCNDEWPFHRHRLLTADQVATMDFVSTDVASFWIVKDGETVGLVRRLDLGDIGEGAPLLDVRIAGPYRGSGLGTHATRWIADYLFATYPDVHRIEANTRDDNAAMQRVLSAAGFTREGRLREAWRGDGQWFDTIVYGILRPDWVATVQKSTK